MCVYTHIESSYKSPPKPLFLNRKHNVYPSKEEMNVMERWGDIGAKKKEGKEKMKDTTRKDS